MKTIEQYEKSINRKNKTICHLRKQLTTCEKTAEDLTEQLNDTDLEYIEACEKEINELRNNNKHLKNVLETLQGIIKNSEALKC